MDPIVGQSMHLVLEEIFDPQFTVANTGFRRGKSQHQGIRHVQELVRDGKEWGIAVDMRSFFDDIPNGVILKLIRRQVADEWFVTLLARMLKTGVIVDGRFATSKLGYAVVCDGRS